MVWLHDPTFFPFYHLIPIFASALEHILKSMAANDMIGPMATRITTGATIIAADALKLMEQQMDFITFDFQKGYPAYYAMVAKSNHRTTANCFLTPVSFCLHHSFEL